MWRINVFTVDSCTVGPAAHETQGAGIAVCREKTLLHFSVCIRKFTYRQNAASHWNVLTNVD